MKILIDQQALVSLLNTAKVNDNLEAWVDVALQWTEAASAEIERLEQQVQALQFSRLQRDLMATASKPSPSFPEPSEGTGFQVMAIAAEIKPACMSDVENRWRNERSKVGIVDWLKALKKACPHLFK